MSKIPMRNVLVVIPGIGGTVLEKDGHEVWNFSGAAAWNLLRSGGKDIDDLAVKNDDPERDFLDDGVRPRELIKLPRVVAALVKTDGYQQLCRFLKSTFAVTPDENYFEFPYDWRRDIRGPARQLLDLLKRALPAWRSRSGSETAKAVIVAHSMGGLVARYCTDVLGGWTECRGLITMATPHRGSLNALRTLANGARMGVDLTPLLASCPSVYQLLPQYRCVSDGTSWLAPADCHGIAHLDNARARAATQVHNEIAAAVQSNRGNAAYVNGYSVMAIVGSDQPTLQSATLNHGGVTMSEDCPPGIDNLLGFGDGTVPAASAIPAELAQQFNIPVFPEQHSMVHSCDGALEVLKHAILLAQVQGLHNLKGAAPAGFDAVRPAISLSLGGTYREGEPVQVKAKLRRVPHCSGMEALVFPVEDQAEPRLVPLLDTGNEWQAEVNALPVGTYRITVRGQASEMAAPPVHDVFTVVPAAKESA